MKAIDISEQPNDKIAKDEIVKKVNLIRAPKTTVDK
jgi:hypothetical protein